MLPPPDDEQKFRRMLAHLIVLVEKQGITDERLASRVKLARDALGWYELELLRREHAELRRALSFIVEASDQVRRGTCRPGTMLVVIEELLPSWKSLLERCCNTSEAVPVPQELLE